MEKIKKVKQLKKLKIDLPQILSKMSSRRSDQKQNPTQQSSVNKGTKLCSKLQNLRSIFLQHKSNTKLLESSPYLNCSNKNRKKLVELISTRKYQIGEEELKELQKKYDIDQQSNNLTNKIQVNIMFQNKTYNVIVNALTSGHLLKVLKFELAKIMIKTKGNDQKCSNLIGFETKNKDQQIDFILSCPSVCISSCSLKKSRLSDLSLCPIFHPIGYRCQVSLKDFKLLKCLGSGGFSTVYLVKNLYNNQYYAMKLIDKQFIIQTQRDAIVENQRFILGELTSEFVTGLKFAFQTKNHFVFCVQYCPGGELFYQLKRVKRMTEQQAKFYFLEILIGLDYIHSKSIIYRDLKPENLLIGIDGHIKIADFGLSKPVQSSRAQSFSFCGSPQYMAPQMLLKSGHNYLLDYYCLGALLYQLIIGIPPYYSLNHQQIYKGILQDQLEFPQHVQLTQELKDLLRSMLQKNYKKRLGAIFGLKEVLLHNWIGRVKHQTIQQKQLIPPFMPDLSCFNFDINDIKTDQKLINTKIQQDMLCKNFQTHFNGQFYYVSPEYEKNIQEIIRVKQESRQRKMVSSISSQSFRPIKVIKRSQFIKSHSTDIKQNGSKNNSQRLYKNAISKSVEKLLPKFNNLNTSTNTSRFHLSIQKQKNLRKVNSTKGFAITVRK